MTGHHRRTYSHGRSSNKKRPRPEEEFSEAGDSQPQRKRSAHDDSEYFLQESNPTPSDTESQPTASQSAAVSPRCATAAAAVKIHFERGLPSLLFEGLQSEEEDVVQKAAKDIQKMVGSAEAVHSTCLLVELIGLGGHSHLVLAMRKFPGNSKIQGSCCSCLGYVIHNWQTTDDCNNTNSLAKQLNIVECLNAMGCMELVVAAVKAFPNDRYVQTSGISCFKNLLFVQNSDKSKKAARKMSNELNGVMLVANAMEAHPMLCDLQLLGCSFFRRLCELGMGKETVMKTSALTAVAAAVQQFPNNPRIEKECYKCMQSIMQPARKPKAD